MELADLCDPVFLTAGATAFLEGLFFTVPHVTEHLTYLGLAQRMPKLTPDSDLILRRVSPLHVSIPSREQELPLDCKPLRAEPLPSSPVRSQHVVR